MADGPNILKRGGSVVHVYELRCPVCKRGLLLSAGEAAPLKVGRVPYCGDCLKAGMRVVMRVAEFSSGPRELRV